VIRCLHHLDNVRNVHYNANMTKILRTNVTTARKNLFLLVDQIINDDIKVILSKDGIKDQVIIQKLNVNYEVESKNDQLNVVRDTAGSIKTSGYNPNELNIAKELFIKSYFAIKTYKKKNGLK